MASDSDACNGELTNKVTERETDKIRQRETVWQFDR